MRGSEWPVGLTLRDPMPTPTQNMSHLFKTWKFSAHDPHPGVMGLARVSILGPPSRKDCITGVHPYRHPGPGASLCERMLMEHGCMTEAMCPHTHVRTLHSWMERKAGRERCRMGPVFPAHRLLAQDTEHPRDPPGLHRSLWRYMWWHRMRKYVLGKFAVLCVHAQSCLTLVTPRTVAYQVPLSTGFSRQEYCSGFPCPLPGDLPDPGIDPTSLASPALASGFFTTAQPGSP